jgi:hypothetical protein
MDSVPVTRECGYTWRGHRGSGPRVGSLRISFVDLNRVRSPHRRFFKRCGLKVNRQTAASFRLVAASFAWPIRIVGQAQPRTCSPRNRIRFGRLMRSIGEHSGSSDKKRRWNVNRPQIAHLVEGPTDSIIGEEVRWRRVRQETGAKRLVSRQAMNRTWCGPRLVPREREAAHDRELANHSVRSPSFGKLQRTRVLKSAAQARTEKYLEALLNTLPRGGNGQGKRPVNIHQVFLSRRPA